MFIQHLHSFTPLILDLLSKHRALKSLSTRLIAILNFKVELVEPWLEHTRRKKREGEVLEEGAHAGTKKEELTEEVRSTDSQGLFSPKGL